MAYPNHQLLTFGGFLGATAAPVETWSCGIRTVALNPIEGANDPEVLSPSQCREFLEDTIRPALVAFWANTFINITSAAKLTFAKYNQIGPDGKYVHSETVQTDFANVPGPNLTTGQHPFQVTKVVTLLADVDRGLASKGRIYLPSPADVVNSDTGQMQSTPNQLANTMHTFLSAIRETDVSMGGLEFVPVICSKITRSGQPTWRSIERVAVDNVLDTQRRRARSVLRGKYFGGAGQPIE